MIIYVVILVSILYLYFAYEPLREGILFEYKIFNKRLSDKNIKKTNDKLISNNKTLNYKQINHKQGHFNGNDKALTSELLSKNDIPVPKYYIWNHNISPSNNAFLIENQLKYPIVAKPNNGVKGYGVKTDITNSTLLLEHVKTIQNSNVIVEEQVYGNEYRILVIDDEIIDVTERVKPHVIGNGIDKLSKLIDDYNKTKKFKIHTYDDNLIKSQGVTMNTIIKQNKIIILTNVANMSNGGLIKNVHLEKVHPANIEMFKRINKIMNTRTLGIDYMSNSIEIPYNISGYVLEVNPSPGLDIHFDKYNGKSLTNMLDKIINHFMN